MSIYLPYDKPRIKVEYVYVSKTNLGCGEYLVEGRLADKTLVFGFKTFNTLEIDAKAREYTHSAKRIRIPVFGTPGPFALEVQKHAR